MLPLRGLSGLCGSVLLSLACQSSVVEAPGPGGASGGAGGGASAACPSDPPAEGAPCDDGGAWLLCHYPDHPGECCQPLATYCQSGTWHHQHVDCYPLCSFVSSVPTDGAACCPSADPVACEQVACDTAGTYTDYGCDGASGTWQVATSPCSDCGGVACGSGEICVVTSGGAAVTPHCAPNPCPPGQATECGCAQSLCPGAPYVCGVSGGMVHCDCATCP